MDDLELYFDLMTTRTGYLIKHTLPSARYNPVIALSQVDVERIAGSGLCYAMILGELAIYSLLHAARCLELLEDASLR